jgi:rhodanese-related sulfurtransferase
MQFRKNGLRFAAGVVALTCTCLAFAGEWDSVPEKKATTFKLYMHPKDVFERMSGAEATKTLFLDVRTPQEAMFVGMTPMVDGNVPYMVMPELPEWDTAKKAFKLAPNSGFVDGVKTRLAAKGLTKDDTVILMCRSGDRSATAANLLAKAGFTKVYSVFEGFEGDLSKDGRRLVNGWKNDGLPWTYELNRDKMGNL